MDEPDELEMAFLAGFISATIKFSHRQNTAHVYHYIDSDDRGMIYYVAEVIGAALRLGKPLKVYFLEGPRYRLALSSKRWTQLFWRMRAIFDRTPMQRVMQELLGPDVEGWFTETPDLP